MPLSPLCRRGSQCTEWWRDPHRPEGPERECTVVGSRVCAPSLCHLRSPSDRGTTSVPDPLLPAALICVFTSVSGVLPTCPQWDGRELFTHPAECRHLTWPWCPLPCPSLLTPRELQLLAVGSDCPSGAHQCLGLAGAPIPSN